MYSKKNIPVYGSDINNCFLFSCDSLVGTYNWPDQPLHLYKGYCLTVSTIAHTMAMIYKQKTTYEL